MQSNYIFVLDTNKEVQEPVHPAEARKLLKEQRAAVHRRFPFTIILKEAKPHPEGTLDLEPIQLKVDPGSKTTGIVLVRNGKVIFAAELEHRGQAIKDALEKRRAIRRGRRNRKTRYRQPRFNNRTRSKGWLPPSLNSRVNNLQTWLVRFIKLGNVQSISMELVRFDMQLMENAEVSGVEYQQGELAGYEVREYLLEKFGRKCVYCGKTDTPLEIEHINPKSRGGSNRVTNLTLACNSCNQRKGSQTAAEFGGCLLGAKVQALAKKPLKDAAAVNATRWAIWRIFDATGIPVEVGTGGRTKFNRLVQALTNNVSAPKQHWIDAACVGKSGQAVKLDEGMQPLHIKAVGRQSRQMCRPDKYGFPRTSAKQSRVVKGFQTGDIVTADIPKGKFAGSYVGRVAVRAKGSFAISCGFDVNWKYCQQIHRADGYAYS